MKEKDFQREIARSVPWVAAQLGEAIHYIKIPDAPMGPDARFAARKGYDCFLVHRGRHVALELKMSKGPSLSFDALNDYQEHVLREVELAGGLSFVVVNFRVNFSQKEARERGTDRAILAFAVRLPEWVNARQEACRGSVPLKAFETGTIALPKLRVEGGIAWDLRPILVPGEPLTRPATSGPEQLELAGVRG